MDEKTSIYVTKDTTSNPAPLGLLGFGLTTILLNLHNAGFFKLGTMILAMGVFYGGFAQIIAGIMEWKKGNTFGTTAFTSYGLFWLTLVGLKVMPNTKLWEAPESSAVVAYLVMWGVFTAFMFVGTLKLSRALQVVFASLFVLFFLLAAATALDNDMLHVIAGWEGVFCGASAVYAAAALVLNDVYKKTVLPLGG
jgi:succinate-acetate transporter protein